MMRLPVLVLVGFVLVEPAAAQTNRTIMLQTVDGQRNAVVTDHGGTRPAPLVFVLHGATGTSEQVRRSMAWDVVAERERLIVVYPQGIGRSWNDGRPAEARRFNPRNAADDVAFLRRIHDDLLRDNRIDHRRVYVTGISNGGHMTYRMVCEASDMVTAGAAIIANLSVALSRACSGRPMPVLVMNGTDDPISTWNGRQGTGGAMQNTGPESHVLSAPETFAFFRRRNGCTGETERALPDRNPDDRSRIVLVEGSGCRAATRLYRVEGGGHMAPGLEAQRLGPGLSRMVGNQNRDIEAAEEIWAFFRTLTR